MTKITDPVCGMTLESEKAAATEEWQGRTYHFCSTSCHHSFRAAPERYTGKAESASACCGGHSGGGHEHGHGGHRQGGGWFSRLFGG